MPDKVLTSLLVTVAVFGVGSVLVGVATQTRTVLIAGVVVTAVAVVAGAVVRGTRRGREHER